MTFYKITEILSALWLVRNLWFIVPVNPYIFMSWKMAAARGELPDFNLLAAFGLEEFRNEKDAMNAEKNEASGEQSNIGQSNKKRRFAEIEKHDLDDIVTNSQAKQTKKATQWAVSVFTGQLKQYKSIIIHHFKT